MIHSAQCIDIVYLHEADNVCVAARNLPAGTSLKLSGQRIELAEPVTSGHKIAVRRIEAQQPLIKFGQTIGFASRDIEPGEHVHSHNVVAGRFDRDHSLASESPPVTPLDQEYTFQGYRRADGRSGTRNYIAIISSVNCSATVARHVAQRFQGSGVAPYPNIDGVVAFTHGSGCGLQSGGEHHQLLKRVLGGIARHPNIGGYLLIGLGCETATLGDLIQGQQLVQITQPDTTVPIPASSGHRSPPVLLLQDMGGTSKTIDAAIRLVARMLPAVNEQHRETLPASQLILGTNCGGSDGHSGITANPALGAASDMLVAAGGTVILAETPEIYGAEQLLTRRARSREVAEKLIERIRWWEWYTGVFGAEIDNNPSPGNKAGGLTTIYEKSLGAVAKGGGTPLMEVYQYAEQVRAKGLVVMDTPGLDPVSVTGIVAGGANVVVFTTGRGSCFGCKPTPSIKVASNTPLFERMQDDIDLDAGTILAGRSIEAVGREIFAEVLAVASGKRTKSELLSIGDEEFVPWHLGPTL